MLTINNLNKNFGKKQVLKNLSYSFEDGVYGLLGPNGAGKTTLIRCLTKLYNTETGAITYNAISITTDKNYLTQIGYLPQKFGMFKDLTVFDMMQLFANFKKVDSKDAKQLIEDCVSIVNLSDRIKSKVGTLSGGMIRRLGIAQAILNNPKIIIFDEPTSGLDPEERLRFKNIISEIKKDKIIIISTHIVDDVEAVCDKVAIMNNKSITISGSCLEIQNIALNKVFDVPDKDKKNINGKYLIQRQFEHDGTKMLKILTNEPQVLKPAIPNVEDGYICILKNI